MKFGIFAVAAFWFVKLSASGVSAAAAAAALDLKPLGFKGWKVHKDSSSTTPTACPLGELPKEVFLHRTVDHNGVHFTWVKPVHGAVNELKCGNVALWKGATGELLLDLHFFGKAKEGVNFLHLEHVTALGGVAHAFLKFDAGATAGAPVGLAKFVAGVADLMGAGFLDVKDLHAHELLHHLALHLA